jgi:dTDP-4-dehydrorhamnose reductase
MTARLLVFGRQGQVARALAASDAPYELEFAGRDRLDLSLASGADIAGLIAQIRPAAAINASAYTAVDRAESEPEACARLNREVPVLLGKACADADIPFVHFSTDYVFAGDKGSPYVEEDERRALNVYGRTKAEGETDLAALPAAAAPAVVLRSSWVFSGQGVGFVQTMARLAKERDEVSVVDDQWGCPTPATACADAALLMVARMLDRDPAARGLFHAAGDEGITWADFAEAIFQGLAGRGRRTPPWFKRITTAEYPTAAARPLDSRMTSARFKQAFGWRPPPFEEGLRAALDQLD